MLNQTSDLIKTGITFKATPHELYFQFKDHVLSTLTPGWNVPENGWNLCSRIQDYLNTPWAQYYKPVFRVLQTLSLLPEWPQQGALSAVSEDSRSLEIIKGNPKQPKMNDNELSERSQQVTFLKRKHLYIYRGNSKETLNCVLCHTHHLKLENTRLRQTDLAAIPEVLWTYQNLKDERKLNRLWFFKLFWGIFIHDDRIWLWIVHVPDLGDSSGRCGRASLPSMWLWEGFDYCSYGLEME